MSSVYTNYFRISEFETEVMKYIMGWVREKKKPVPYHKIIVYMKKQAKKEPAIAYALHSLVRKGYIRRTYFTSNKTFYVQLRTL